MKLFSSVIPRFSRETFERTLIGTFKRESCSILKQMQMSISSTKLAVTGPNKFIRNVGVRGLLATRPRKHGPYLVSTLGQANLTREAKHKVSHVFRKTLGCNHPLPSCSESGKGKMSILLPEDTPSGTFIRLLTRRHRHDNGSVSLSKLLVLSGLGQREHYNFSTLSSSLSVDGRHLHAMLKRLARSKLMRDTNSNAHHACALKTGICQHDNGVIRCIERSNVSGIHCPRLVVGLVHRRGAMDGGSIVRLLRLSKGRTCCRLQGLIGRNHTGGMKDNHGTQCATV